MLQLSRLLGLQEILCWFRSTLFGTFSRRDQQGTTCSIFFLERSNNRWLLISLVDIEFLHGCGCQGINLKGKFGEQERASAPQAPENSNQGSSQNMRVASWRQQTPTHWLHPWWPEPVDTSMLLYLWKLDYSSLSNLGRLLGASKKCTTLNGHKVSWLCIYYLELQIAYWIYFSCLSTTINHQVQTKKYWIELKVLKTRGQATIAAHSNRAQGQSRNRCLDVYRGSITWKKNVHKPVDAQRKPMGYNTLTTKT